MRRKISAFLITICILMTLTACGEKKDGEIEIYYLTIDKTGLLTENYDLPDGDAMTRVDGVIDKLSSQPDNSTDCTRTIPKNVEIVDENMDGNNLYLYFNSTYSTMSGAEEPLVRTAIVKSLLQIDGVDSVTFYVGDQALTDSTGTLVGTMTADSFLDYLGESTQSLNKTTLTLYYAAYDGLSLREESREIYYNSNVPKERLVMDYLMRKPESSDLKSPIPAGVKLNSITVDDDGLCVVTFDATILSASSDVSEQVMVYAIVDSLTELDDVNSVQIQVDSSGAMADISAGNSYVGKVYTRDMSMVSDTTDGE